jgi:hypothetical protein
MTSWILFTFQAQICVQEMPWQIHLYKMKY